MKNTINQLRNFWQKISFSNEKNTAFNPDLDEESLAQIKVDIDYCVHSMAGEMSLRTHACKIASDYQSLSEVGREKFCMLLLNHYHFDQENADTIISNWKNNEDGVWCLRAALESQSLKLFKLFNGLNEGVKFLVDMRADMLSAQKHNIAFKPLQNELKYLLKEWFDLGFLELKEVNWNSPALLLEKLIKYEAVHAIRGWSDLKNRLDSDRYCYAFFHPQMENEPLIFIEVALTNGVVGNIDQLLDENAPTVDPMSADSAMFYSISNTQSGLAGISFGNYLIKSVVKELQKNHPNLTNFATLSPIPGFNHWLDQNISTIDEVLSKDEKDALISVSQSATIESTLKTLLYSSWLENESVKEVLDKPLRKLALHYLSKEKSGNNRAKDPVAHFHLSNGASIGKIHVLANTSSRGMKESSGMMLNYLYMLDKIENNGIQYVENGIISTDQVKKKRK